MVRKTTLILSIIILFSTALTPNYLLFPSAHNEHTGGRSVSTPCGGPSNTHSITILPPGPVTLPADQSRIFTATLKDSNGTTLGGSPDWSVSDGSINPQGGGDAIYYPNTVGNHTVWACAADAVASIQVIVTIGATESIELIGNKNNVTADETIEFVVMETDLRGNSAPLFVPSSGWTIPEGSGINVLPGFETTTGGFIHQPAMWYPGSVGSFDIMVSVDGLHASWNVNVSRGVGTNLVIEIDRTIITSDESIELAMSISDVRGNLWPVIGEWTTLAPEAMGWLTIDGNQSTFNGGLVGNWTIHAEYNGPENGFINMSDEVTIDVRVGRISLVEIQGHDTTMLTGEVLQLGPIATDLEGNIIEDAIFNWSVEGTSGVESIDVINQTFIPTTQGQHNILAESGGRPSSIRVQVEWSEPIDLNVTTGDGDWYLTVTTGETLPLHVEGFDVRGEWHPYNPVWEIDENFGSIEESGGDGDYLYHAQGVNWTQLHAFVGENEFTILVFVTPGVLDNIEITVTDRGVQGNSVPFTLKGFDISGNGVSIPVCDVTVSSTAGRTECNDDSWILYLDNGGEQQIIKATYEDANGSGFIDVQPTLLDGQFGSSTQVIAAGAIFIALLISVVLIVAYLRVKRLAEEFDEEYEDEDEDEDDEFEGDNYVPEIPLEQNAPLPKGMTAPPPHMGMPFPPPPMMQRMQMGKKKMAPSPPPPSFMFGTGITSNSSVPQPVQGVFVRSESKYGWEDPSNQQIPPPGYGWEQIGSTSVSTTPSSPQIVEEKTSDPTLEQTSQENEMPSELSGALSMFPSATTDNDGDLDAIEEEDTVPELETIEEKSIEEHIDEISEDNTPVSDDSYSEDIAWEDDSQNEETETDEEGNWDSWGDDWSGDQDSEDEVNEEEVIEEEVIEEEVIEVAEDEIQVVGSGLGPCTEGNDILKPLPGTKAGESGWYFDSDGKPTLWEFRELGWERIN